MRLFARHRLLAQRRGGFTLTEVAIVFSVMGLVIGSVWFAASGVQQGVRLNQASDELRQVVTNVYALYAGQNVSYANLNAAHALSAPPLAVPSSASTFCFYTPILINQKIFPAEMFGKTSVANNVWSQVTDCSGTVGSAAVSLACSLTGGICDSTKPVQFIVRYSAVTSSFCAQLLMINSIPGTDTKLVRVTTTWTGSTPSSTSYIYDKPTATYQLPITAANAQTACTGTGTLAIDWYYQLGG